MAGHGGNGRPPMALAMALAMANKGGRLSSFIDETPVVGQSQSDPPTCPRDFLNKLGFLLNPGWFILWCLFCSDIVFEHSSV